MIVVANIGAGDRYTTSTRRLFLTGAMTRPPRNASIAWDSAALSAGARVSRPVVSAFDRKAPRTSASIPAAVDPVAPLVLDEPVVLGVGPPKYGCCQRCSASSVFLARERLVSSFCCVSVYS